MTIDQLQIEIQGQASSASTNIDSLTNSLKSLKGLAGGGAGLTTFSNQLTKINSALASLSVNPQKITSLVTALNQLGGIGKSNLGTNLNQLKKIPEIIASLDKANLSKFNTQIQQLVTYIKPLAAEMQKVSNGFSKLPTNIQKAINANARLIVSNGATTKSYVSMGFGIKAWAAKLMIAVYSVRRIGNVIAGWISESNAYVENVNLFTVAMGEYADEALKYATTVSEVMGIDISDWIRNQGIFMTLATGFGIASESAAKMSKNLTQLGYDISSFYNIKVEDAMLKLQSGLAGELEPLRRLGWDLSQASLQAIALANGIDKSVATMTQAEKAQLRYYAIMTQVTQVQGDMARTLQSPANQLRILAAQATMAARALGNIFIPALNAILPYAIAFLKVVRLIGEALAKLFGFTMVDIDYSGLNGTASGVDDITDSLGGASDAAKKLKGQLAGFDQLNVIAQTDTSGGGASGGGGGGGGLDLAIPEYDFLGDAIDTRISEIYNKWKPKIESAINWLKDHFEAVKGAVLGIGLGLLAWKLSSGFTGGLAALGKNLKTIASSVLIVAGAAALLGGAFDSWDKGMNWGNLTTMLGGGASLVAGLAIAFGLLTGAIGAFVAGLVILVTSFKDVWTNGKTVANTIGMNIGTALTGVLGIIGQVILATKDLFSKKTGDSIKATWDDIVSWLKSDVFVWFTKEKWDEVFSNIGKCFGYALDGLVIIFGKIIPDWWNNDVKPWFTLERWKTLFAAINTALALKLSSMKTESNASLLLWWNEVSAWFTIAKWKELGGHITDGIAQGLRGAVNAVGTIINSISSVFEGLINGIIGAINKMIDGFNSVSKLVKITRLPEISIGKVGTDSTGSRGVKATGIQAYATGGFPEDGLFFANHGEMVGGFSNGKTAVANNDQIVSGIASGVASANEAQNALLKEQNALLRKILAKDGGPIFAPTAEAGRWASKSLGLYDAVKG